MMQRFIGQFRSLVTKLTSGEHTSLQGDSLSRSEFLEIFGTMLGFMTLVPLVGTEGHCQYNWCDPWVCSSCYHPCNTSGPYRQCTRECHFVEACAGYRRDWTQTKCVPC